MARKCPRCGRGSPVGRAHPHREGIAGTGVSAATINNHSRERVSENVPVCFDPGYTCEGYPLYARDPFWPTFAHPRWLSCRELYRGHRMQDPGSGSQGF